MRPGKRRALDKSTPWGRLLDKLEQLKASIRAKVEHPFRVIKCQFGFVKVEYRGLAKNTANLMTLFALSNLWMARRRLLRGAGMSAPKQGGNAHHGPQKAANPSERVLKFGENAIHVSSDEPPSFNSRESRGCADLPW